jgi:L-lactate dehydrogenase complex protein LldG
VTLLGRTDPDAASRLQTFGRQLRAVGGQLHEGFADGGLAAVCGLLRRHAPRAIAASDAPEVEALQRHADLRSLPWLPPRAAKDALFGADVGLTAAQWGVAETGTLVLDSASERHRLASLLPPVHIALLRASHVLDNLGELLKTLRRPLSPAVTFITGPSRTADIELQLVIGVHGPRELHVVVV